MIYTILGITVFLCGMPMYFVMGNVLGWYGIIFSIPIGALVGFASGRLISLDVKESIEVKP